MNPDQEATWHALIELADVHPADWCLVGGQMVALHAYENERQPPRLTTDGDLVIDIRADPQALTGITRVLQARGFEEAELSADEIGHRWIRGQAVLDLLVPEGSGGAERRKTVTGARTIEAAGTTQALGRAQLVDVGLPDGTLGRVSRPSLLGAIIAKCAAADVDTGPRGRGRHLTDVAFLCSLVTDLRGLRADVTRKDRQRVTRVFERLTADHAAWLDQPDPTLAFNRLKALGTPLQQ